MTILASHIASVIEEAIPRIACELRPDVRRALDAAYEGETGDRGREVLAQLIKNSEIAVSQRMPLCQDTGTVWVWVELGQDESIGGDLYAQIDEAVARAYEKAHLRASVVHDALFDRTNTKTNTPAFVDITLKPGPGATVHVMLKGGGSDNASRVVMLAPGEGWEGVKTQVLTVVKEKASSACPPLIIGVGVGATFDKVGSYAKRALLREVGSSAQDGQHALREQELLEAVNATGIGPGGLGGDTTALAVHLATAPCHIAALPVAINMGCSAMRSTTIEVSS